MNTVSYPVTVEEKGLFSQSGLPAGYLWQNMRIEKRSSNSWLYDNLYKDSIIHAFWLLITSPIK